MLRHPVVLLTLCAALALGACADGREAPPAAAGSAAVGPAPAPAPLVPESDPAPVANSGADPVAADLQALAETDPTCGVLELTDEEWRARLTPEEYRILREGGTERAFTGKYWKTKTPGKYVCSGCELDLFASTTKFDSGTGWPSFWEPVAEENVKTRTDRSLGVARTEILCGRCDAHLGHVFSDGPRPTGQRYCVNSMALKLVPDGGAGAKD